MTIVKASGRMVTSLHNCMETYQHADYAFIACNVRQQSSFYESQYELLPATLPVLTMSRGHTDKLL